MDKKLQSALEGAGQLALFGVITGLTIGLVKCCYAAYCECLDKAFDKHEKNIMIAHKKSMIKKDKES